MNSGEPVPEWKAREHAMTMTRIDPRQVKQRLRPTLDVQIGDVAMVEPQGVGERFKTCFVGWDAGRFAIMRLPTRLDLRDFLYAGKVVIVRYLSCSGEVSGFESEVQGVCHKPQQLFFVDYPAKVEVFSLRKESRVDTFLPATLVVSDQISLKGNILNISKGGARIGLDRGDYGQTPFTIGQQFVCQFQMLDQDTSLNSFIGVVRTITEEANKFYLGVQFKEISDAVREKIETYVQSVSEYMGAHCLVRS